MANDYRYLWLMADGKKYYPALDGLRAYAALAVLAYHTAITAFWLGWTGVHFFFVLSGFLIVSILLDSKDAENYFKVFYARRFLRIFPIYYLALFSVTIVAIMAKRDISSFFWYLFYAQNFKLAFHNWNITTFPHWLNHTWTLAIEEQFYILFPLLVKYLKRGALAIVCFGFILLAVFVRYYLSLKFPGNTINWGNTFANFDFLAAGALLAIGIKQIKPKTILAWLWVLFALFIIAYFILAPHPFMHPIYLNQPRGQFFLIGLLLFACIAVFTLVTQRNKILSLLFENRAVVYIGKISYGLYLYHYPFFKLADYFGRHYAITNVFVLVGIKLAGSLLVAGLSFRYFETPIMKLKNKYRYNQAT